jgi:hypothetical protein
MSAYETARNMVQQLLKGEQSPTPEIIREKVQSIVAVLPQLGFSEVIDTELLIRELETLGVAESRYESVGNRYLLKL